MASFLFDVPIKWKKNLLLVEYGFIEYENLLSEIHRYSFLRIADLCIDIKNELINDIKINEKAFYIVKLVNNNQYYKLPNYRIYKLDDIESFKSFIIKSVYHIDELWYCRTLYFGIDSESYSVSGRLLFAHEEGKQAQIIEQTWNNSPRIIDEYNNSIDVIFTRATRPSWGCRYILNHLNIPNNSNNGKDNILMQFQITIKEIERIREKIEVFENYLNNFEYNNFNIEYKNINGKLSIIDWDTPNDSLVLRNSTFV